MNEFDFANFDTAELCGWHQESHAEAIKSWGQGPGEYWNTGLASTQQRVMLWELVRKVINGDTPNYRQEIGDCYVGNTQVLMSNGHTKDIKDIRIGDEVVTHTNSIRKVINTISKKYDGYMYTIKPKYHYTDFTCTSSHQFPIFKNNVDHYEWTNADQIKINEDNLFVPFGINKSTYQMIRFLDRDVLVDEDFAYIIGWYLAEGGVSGNTLKDGSYSWQKVTFNLCIDEEDVADELIRKIDKLFGLEAKKQYHKSDQNVLLVEVYNIYFSRLIKELIPGNVYTKRVPQIIIQSPINVKEICLKSWLAGDGYIKPNGNMVLGCSVSPEMISDFYHICISLELNPKISRIPQQPHQTCDSYKLTLGASSYRKLYKKEQTRDHTARFSNLGLLREIESINRVYVKDVDVYCIEVEEDHSFIANGIATHNCVSFSAKNAMEYLQCVQIALGQRQQFKLIFPPYIYGISRVQIGGGRLWDDGSNGVWAAQGVMKYGVLSADAQNCPKYSGRVARSWGSSGPPNEFINIGKEHLVKSTAQVQTWDDLKATLSNGYPVTVASDYGFDMQPRSDGFNHYSTYWGHQMCAVGYDDGDSNIEPHVCILNSWGDIFGHIKDFRTGADWPIGTLRVRRRDIEGMLNAGDSWAYSGFDGFPAQALPESYFDMLIG